MVGQKFEPMYKTFLLGLEAIGCLCRPVETMNSMIPKRKMHLLEWVLVFTESSLEEVEIIKQPQKKRQQVHKIEKKNKERKIFWFGEVGQKDLKIAAFYLQKKIKANLINHSYAQSEQCLIKLSTENGALIQLVNYKYLFLLN